MMAVNFFHLENGIAIKIVIPSVWVYLPRYSDLVNIIASYYLTYIVTKELYNHDVNWSNHSIT